MAFITNTSFLWTSCYECSYTPRTKIRQTVKKQENKFIRDAIDRGNMKLASIAKNVIAEYGIEPEKIHPAAISAYAHRGHLLSELNTMKTEIQTQKFSLDGLQALNALYEQIRTAINPKISMLGVLPTMVDRTSVSKNALTELHEKYGDMLFKTVISKSVEAAKSSENGIPLCMTAHKLGREYDDLAMEVLSIC